VPIKRSRRHRLASAVAEHGETTETIRKDPGDEIGDAQGWQVGDRSGPHAATGSGDMADGREFAGLDDLAVAFRRI